MPVLSVGDRASGFEIRRFSTGLKTDLTRLGKELTTGKKSDLGTAVSGDFGPLAAIERSLAAIAAYKVANAETAQFLEASQLALDGIQTAGQSLTPGLLTASTSRSPAMIEATAEDARQKLATVVSRINTRAADRSLFAGAATDTPAVASAEDILDELTLAIAGATTSSDIVSAVDAWFDTPGGGFETSGYLGSDTDLGPFTIAEGESVAFSVRADNDAIRETLKGFALAALIDRGALPGDIDERAALLAEAASCLMTADGAVTALRADVGADEARVDSARTRNAAEATAYELALTEISGVDPYQAASELEAVYGQIETLYTVTARLAGLRFTDYMR